MNQPHNDNFFRKLIKEQERLMLGKKECKTNETKKEDLLLSRRSTKPKLTAQQQYEPIDSSRGGSSEKSERVQVPRMEHETLMKTAKDKQAAEMKRTKALLGQEMEQFKSELDFQIQEENKKLKEDLEESQRVNIQNWRKKYIADYKKKLADALQETRVEMQQDHQKKVEMLRLDHLREINNIRQKYMDEESALRQSLLASMQEEREALQASHCEQLGSLRLQFDQQMEQMKLEHSQKKADLVSRKEMLMEELEVDRQIGTLNQPRQDNQLKQDLEKTTKDRWDMSRREEETLKETSDKALKTGQAARPVQEQLEKRVEQLEKEYKHLASSLEMDKMKAANAQERVASCKKMGSSLHLEDNEQALIHLQKVRSFLEGELCNVSGGKAKNEREETVEKMQKLQQELKREKEEKNGLRKEKKQLKKKIEQLEQRIEQLEKRAEHLDNKNNRASDRLGPGRVMDNPPLSARYVRNDNMDSANNISQVPLQEESLIHQMNINQMCTGSPNGPSSLVRYPKTFGVNCCPCGPTYGHPSPLLQGTTGSSFPVNPLQCYPSNVPSGVCNLHFVQSSGDINSYREALKVNSTKSWWDKHKRAL
ncbi:trichohyalin-like [Takifugu rubripes]|uniref:trichohyalin-like n=1 Tax=Takifugu rubripes TaxID=31033 RepID=UPI00114521A8|nr:trichohyalin-like [Takifugu rubripes]